MAKTKLCSNDEGNLVEEMKAFKEKLEDMGIEGVSVMSFSNNGEIRGAFTINPETSLLVSLEKDGDKRTLEYRYV